jgi:hypothetical protein
VNPEAEWQESAGSGFGRTVRCCAAVASARASDYAVAIVFQFARITTTTTTTACGSVVVRAG